MKKTLLAIILPALTIALNAETNATMLYDGGPNALLVDKNTFYVTVKDEVTGGCLPKPNQLKLKMERSLKNNGFEIVENGKNPFIPEVHISTLGFKINSMCVVDLTVNILFPIIVKVPNASNVPSGNQTYVTYNYDIGRYIANYRRPQMQGQLNKIVQGFGDKIYMKIAKSKDDIFVKFPSIQEEIKKGKE